MKRRDFLRSGTVFLGGAFGASAALSLGGNCFIGHAMAQSKRKEKWISPSSITPLQCYVLIAKEKGYFDAEGLDITIQPTPGTASAITQVASGQALFSQGAAITTVPAIANQNAEVITIGQVIYKSVFEVASPKGKPLSSPKDWVGKTIGIMSVGGSTDQLVDAMMVASGVDPKSVKKAVTGLSAGAYAFLERGQVDAFLSFYSMRIALDAQNVQLSYVNTDDFAPIPPDSVLLAKSALATEADRKASAAYMRACAKGMQYLLDKKNYAEIAEYLAKYNPVEAQDKEVAFKKFEVVADLAKRPPGVPFMHCDDKAWATGVELMAKIGMIKPNAKPLGEYYTNDIAKMI